MLTNELKRCFVDLLFYSCASAAPIPNTQFQAIRTNLRKKWRHLETIARREVTREDALKWLSDIEKPDGSRERDITIIARDDDRWESQSGRYVILGPSKTVSGKFQVLETDPSPVELAVVDHYWEAFMIVENAAVSHPSRLEEAA